MDRFVVSEFAEALVSGFDEVFGGFGAEFIELIDDPVLKEGGGLFGVAVGSAEGFVDDGIDDAVLEIVLGGEIQGDGGGVVGLLVGLLPEDRGTALGGDDGVPGVLEHGYAVGDGDAEGSARAAFTDDDGDDGDFQPAHLAEVDGDGLGLSAFFCSQTRVSARGVYEGDDGESEFLCFAHLCECFAVALGVGAPEMACEFFLRGFAFLMADDEAFAVADASESGDECGIVGEGAVAVEFAEISGDVFDVVTRLRAVRVAGHADGVPGGEVFVDILECLDASSFEEFEVRGVRLDFLGLDAGKCGNFRAFGFDRLAGEFDFFLDGDDGFFELELVES